MPTGELDTYAIATILKSGFQAKERNCAEWVMYMLNKSGCGLYNSKEEWVGIASVSDLERFISRWRPSPLEAQEARLRHLYPDGVFDKNKEVEEAIILNPQNMVTVPITKEPEWQEVQEEKPVEYEYPVTVDAYKELDVGRAQVVLEDARYKAGWRDEDMSLMIPREIAMRELEHVSPTGEWALVGQGPVVWVNQWRGVRYVITQDLRVFALAVQAQEMLVEAIVGDTMLITDVLWAVLS